MSTKLGSERFMVLGEVVEHIRRGPYALYLGRDEDSWLEAFVSMSQFTLTEGQYEIRDLFMVSGWLWRQQAPLAPLARRVVWERLADGKRCDAAVVEWPDVQVDYYRIDDEELGELDTLLKDFQEAFGSYPFKPPRIGTWSSKDMDQERDPAWDEPIPAAPAHRRWIALSLAPGLSGELTSTERATTPEFDERWSQLWDGLGKACRDDRRATGYREAYWVHPELYAKALASTLT